ncbi:MAG: SpoIIE family protein phosphatase [Desulfobacterales bacterium]|jgi:sigma-B regulation protein RsbU (phosphoserine phosphatase)|nr:SpoIIE family protein phosphatase [Desulfobacterales bacterium]
MNKEKRIVALETKIDSIAEELVMVYEELNLFYDISESMSSSFSLDETIDLILNDALDIIEADKGAIMILNESENELRVIKGLSFGNGNRVDIDPSYKINVEGGGLKRAIQGKRGFIVNDITRLQDGISNLIATKSLLCTPLNAKNRIIGALTLGDRRKGMEFTSKDLKRSAVLASLVAFVIENARLLQHYLEKQRLEKELEIAQDIQRKLLPLAPPYLEGYDIAALSIPCIQVGGDYYDFIPMADGRLGIAIGDVMGHGVGAALLMATVRSALRALSEGTLEIRDVLYRINNMLINDTKESRYLMTLFYGILDLKNRRLTFSNAGHDYPFVLRSSSTTFEFLESTGTVIGMFDNYSYNQSEFQLEPGDVAFFYTDGAVEVTGDSKEQFGRERLWRLVQENRDLGARGLIDKIYSEVAAFSGSRLMDDDLMLVVLKVNG